MDSYLATINTNAAMLTQKYLDLKPNMLFKRSLEDFLQHEASKLVELTNFYREKLAPIKFLKPSYFRDFDSFKRYQEIPQQYFAANCKIVPYFISHQWESTLNPDPTGKQFLLLKSYIEKFAFADQMESGFWYDFSCVPQKDLKGLRTAEEERVFCETLKLMHILTTVSRSIILFDDGHLDRSWCCTEWILASTISPLLVNKDQIFPFGNALKFRHLALVILFLNHELKVREKILDDDNYIVPFIDSLLLKTIESTKATYSGDKVYLLCLLHRHFWYHIRMLGLRNQLAIGFLLLNRYKQDFVEELFRQFLFLSEDPTLAWTREALIDIDTMILDEEDPFNDVHFHNNKIEVRSHSFVKY